jgi:hypothetical protein
MGAFYFWDNYLPLAILSRLHRWIDYWVGTGWARWLGIYVPLISLAIIASIIFVSAVLLYVAARLFIVVESFISLRHVPIGVYRTPNTNFMSYIPHL